MQDFIKLLIYFGATVLPGILFSGVLIFLVWLLSHLSFSWK